MDKTIVCFDEVSYQLQSNFKQVWAKKGTKPEGIFRWTNKKVSMFGAIVNGKKLFYKWTEKQNSKEFILFLQEFIKTLDRKKKYLFLLDNASWHKSKMVKEYLESLNSFIEVDFFPPYSPQLNCIEKCWSIIKQNVCYSNYFKSLDDLKSGIATFIEEYQFNFNLFNYLCL